MVYTDRISQQSHCKEHFPKFHEFRDFSNNACVILEEKGKEVIKGQLYSRPKKVWERWREPQKSIQMYHITKQIWWETKQDVVF